MKKLKKRIKSHRDKPISLLILIYKLEWIEKERLNELKTKGEEIAKMLNSLIKSIKQ